MKLGHLQLNVEQGIAKLPARLKSVHPDPLSSAIDHQIALPASGFDNLTNWHLTKDTLWLDNKNPLRGDDIHLRSEHPMNGLSEQERQEVLEEHEDKNEVPDVRKPPRLYGEYDLLFFVQSQLFKKQFVVQWTALKKCLLHLLTAMKSFFQSERSERG